jgi:hypothetical protein
VTPDLSPVLVPEYRKALAGLGPVPMRDWTELSSYRFIVGREDGPGTSSRRHPQWRNDRGVTAAYFTPYYRPQLPPVFEYARSL